MVLVLQYAYMPKRAISAENNSIAFIYHRLQAWLGNRIRAAQSAYVTQERLGWPNVHPAPARTEEKWTWKENTRSC